MRWSRLNLVGPIFAKELRMVSRRRRYYALRVAFAVLFVLFLISTWYQVMRLSTSVVGIAARMSGAGKEITAFVIWFEFIACQLVAGVMLSTSISDEISSKTLGVLMTTPITSLQIVVGKLLSRLLQVCLLLAITLPLLAVIRVFGGVPWVYLLSSLTVILCRCLLVGSVSLVFSIYARRAYVAIIATGLTFVLLDGILPGIVAVYFHDEMPAWLSTTYLHCCNSFTLMVVTTETMLSGRGAMPDAGIHWLTHNLLLLTFSAFLIGWAALRVRRIGLQMVTGAATSRSRVTAGSKDRVRLRRVQGNPVLWKEMHQPLLGHRRRRALVLMILILVTMALFYAGMARNAQLAHTDTQIMFGLILVGIGLLYSTVIPATVVSTEKEARSWPILLGTTLTSWQILKGKWWGSLRHSLPAWFLLIGHLVIFTGVQVVHPLGLPLLALAMCGPIFFLQGAGLFFSTCFQRTTTAVIANLSLAAVVWLLFPMLLGMFLLVYDEADGFMKLVVYCNPWVQTVVILDTVADTSMDLDSFDWPMMGRHIPAGRTVAMLAFSAFLYGVAGGAFLLLSCRRLRSRIF